jgi:hypothetical protein
MIRDAVHTLVVPTQIPTSKMAVSNLGLELDIGVFYLCKMQKYRIFVN